MRHCHDLVLADGCYQNWCSFAADCMQDMKMTVSTEVNVANELCCGGEYGKLRWRINGGECVVS